MAIVRRKTMFTGIVEEIGRIGSTREGGLRVSAVTVLDDLRVGDSVSVSGVCLTVTGVDETSFSVDVVPETLRRTTLGSLKAEDPINLERSLPATGRFGGHIVQGHVDGKATIRSIDTEGEARLVRFVGSSSIMRYVVEKGFVAVDGISLTVVDCDPTSFLVTLIPHTFENTTFNAKAVGDSVNIEVDILAKYVERLSSPQGTD